MQSAPGFARTLVLHGQRAGYYDGAKGSVYRPWLENGKPEMTVRDADGKVTSIKVSTAPAHNYLLHTAFCTRRSFVLGFGN
jgi:hypothetical protein